MSDEDRENPWIAGAGKPSAAIEGVKAARLATYGDTVLPFELDMPGPGLRGRLVRLDGTIEAILNRHDYAEPLARLLGETAALSCALADALKYEGVFSLQAQGNGPVKLLVSDVTSDGHLRAYAGLSSEAEAGVEKAIAAAGGQPSLNQLLGSGYVAFTVDQGQHTELYQGIVELVGPGLAECVHHYFQQSEQLATIIKSACGKDKDGRWRAAAIMLQRMPMEQIRRSEIEEAEESWRKAAIILGTVKDAELLDPALSAEALLYRLYHEDGVRVFPAKPVIDQCRCSPERVAHMLLHQPREALEDLKIDQGWEVTCQFCSRDYHFTEDDLNGIEVMTR